MSPPKVILYTTFSGAHEYSTLLGVEFEWYSRPIAAFKKEGGGIIYVDAFSALFYGRNRPSFELAYAMAHYINAKLLGFAEYDRRYSEMLRLQQYESNEFRKFARDMAQRVRMKVRHSCDLFDVLCGISILYDFTPEDMRYIMEWEYHGAISTLSELKGKGIGIVTNQTYHVSTSTEKESFYQSIILSDSLRNTIKKGIVGTTHIWVKDYLWNYPNSPYIDDVLKYYLKGLENMLRVCQTTSLPEVEEDLKKTMEYFLESLADELKSYRKEILKLMAQRIK